MRLLIHSLARRAFLVPDADGQPGWVESLRDAGAGVLRDPEQAQQTLEDWTDWDDRAVIVDLDRLGTPDDYPA